MARTSYIWWDEVSFVLDQQAYLDLYSASSLKHQSAGRHVALSGHIILIPNQHVCTYSIKTVSWADIIKTENKDRLGFYFLRPHIIFAKHNLFSSSNWMRSERWSYQTTDNKTGICCFPAKEVKSEAIFILCLNDGYTKHHEKIKRFSISIGNASCTGKCVTVV
jgi:hypothetical protein